jgi:hypothetical protein
MMAIQPIPEVLTNSNAVLQFRDMVFIWRTIMRACRLPRSDIPMQIPTWTKPALYGAGAGAVALAIIGFTWGGWVTGGTAQELADTAAATAIAAVMTPYCVERSASDPRSIEILTELKAAQGYNRRGIVEKAGWATPLGTDQPNKELAKACEIALAG